MRPYRIVLGLVASLALLSAPVTAAPGGAAHAIQGGGWRLSAEDVPRVEFNIDARLSSHTGLPVGSYNYANPFTDTEFHAEITCMEIEGSAAVVAGTIASGNQFVGENFVLWLTDAGGSTFGEFGPDSISQTYVAAEIDGLPMTCPAPDSDPFDPGLRLTVLGDITVIDGLD